MMENVFEILKDLPKPGDYVLLTVAKGSAAGEKAILAEKKIIWESKENGFFSAHFSEAGDLKKCGLYEIREQQVFCDIIGGQEHLVSQRFCLWHATGGFGYHRASVYDRSWYAVRPDGGTRH